MSNNTVYILFKCYYDYCETWKIVVGIVETVEEATAWIESFESTETEWHSFTEWKTGTPRKENNNE
jgi:hypothetical protein